MVIRDLINGSLRLLNVLAEGEVANASQAQDALAGLNSMLDSWSTESLTVLGSVIQTVTLTKAQQVYTMGPGGDINISRPTSIDDVSVLYPNAAQSVFLPMDEMTQAQYLAIPVIGYQTPIPQGFYFNAGFPFNQLYIYPMPQAGTQLRFAAMGTITEFGSVNDTGTLAPGYERAMRYSLAVEIAPEYGVTPSEAVVATAVLAKQNIQRLNAQDIVLGVDVPIGWRGGWNRITGDWN